MKKRFLIALGAFVLFAIIFGIYQSKSADVVPVDDSIASSTVNVVDTAIATGTVASITTNNQTKPMSTITAQKGDTVFVHYTGKLTNGTVFDSSIPRGQPFAFKLGAGMVIAGWEKGILGMTVGEKKTLTIPAADGYGEAGAPDGRGGYVIPPNATLVFDVELVDVKR
jgi:FKBP-type peptidyl-prolyl cis-trans isomerase